MKLKGRSVLFYFVKGAFLSILFFFAVSFLSLFSNFDKQSWQLAPHLKIGWPLIYYEQFRVGNAVALNGGWNPDYLLMDCLLFFVVISGLYFFWKFTRS